jgi:hypothetical protein
LGQATTTVVALLGGSTRSREGAIASASHADVKEDAHVGRGRLEVERGSAFSFEVVCRFRGFLSFEED